MSVFKKSSNTITRDRLIEFNQATKGLAISLTGIAKTEQLLLSK